jgi:ArsR family transcriptional regulator
MQMNNVGTVDMIAAAKALGDQTRARIVGLLGVHALCVCELKVVLSLSQATVSGHLRVLFEAGLLTTSKRSYWTLYAMRDDLSPEILKFVSLLTEQVGAQFPDDRNRLAEAPTLVCSVSSKKLSIPTRHAGHQSRKSGTSK